MHGRCSILQEKNRFEISLFDKYLEKPDSLCLCGTNINKRYYSRSIQIHLFRKLHKILTHFFKHGVFFGKLRTSIRRFLFYVVGFRCPELNIKGSNIQPHYDTNCSIDIPACPFRYNSQDVYKCMFYLNACYKNKP